MTKRKDLAIVGIGCRFPGNANTPEEFWNLMCDEQDAIVPVPKARWDVRKYYDANPDKPGKTYVKEGGFLHQEVTEFDPEFFNISPREAMTMDPQQRLLLESAWEAIEDSGTPLKNLQKLRTGVFVGGFCLDSKLIQLNPLNKDIINSFTSAAITLCILSNRISHAFDLTGPSMSVDTACSSSLVATHLACQSIWHNDADLALVGGVNVMMKPEYFVGMSKGRFLSPRARCHAFDSRADGYVRGEGCGVLLIKTLEQAIQDGDRVYSVILGSGVNQDGRTAGISLPSSEAQEKLIKFVYNKADVAPEKINYVEAHGTGTQQGDYAEAMALHRVFQNKDEPCIVGSVKTNIGHLEAAAGVAGLIKASLALYHGGVPSNLHFVTPNEKLPFETLKIKIAQGYQELPQSVPYHYAGVNSFGYGGTNAHIILRSETKTNATERAVEWPVIYPLSARGESALQSLSKMHKDLLGQDIQNDSQFADLLYTLSHRRTHHDYRLAVIGATQTEVQAGLDAFSRGEPSPHVIHNKAPALVKHLSFVYTGMGPQWWGMGQQLYHENKVFSAWVKRCEPIFKAYSEWSLTEELLRNQSESKMSRADVAQPLNFVIQVGLTEIMQSWGIQPDCVVGHSVGEISAAYIAGAFSLEDALLISYHRSRLQQSCAGCGAMLAANISVEKAQVFLAEHQGVAIAAVNGAEAITLAGNQTSLEKIAEQLTGAEAFNRMLKVDVAYHSPEMDPIESELLESLQSIKPMKTHIPLYSTVTGDLIEGDELDAAYWWQNVRQSVLFKDAIDALLQSDRFNVLVELGPHPVTKNYLGERLTQSKYAGKTLFSLHREQAETLRGYSLLSELYTLGYDLHWDHFLPQGGVLMSLPQYPWQRQKYWIEGDKTESERHVESDYLFLSKKLNHPRPSWEVELNEHFFPYVADHRLDQMVVFPGAGFVEAGLQLAHKVNGTERLGLSEIRFDNMLIVEKDKTQKILSEVDPENGNYTIWSTENKDVAWTAHSKGKILQDYPDLGSVSLPALQLRCQEEVDSALIYDLFAKEGLHYGAQFRGVERLWRSSSNEILAKLRLPMEAEQSSYFIHPVLLDSAFHSLMALENDLTEQPPYVPTKIRQLLLDGKIEGAIWAHTRILERNEHFIREEISLIDDSGKIICRVDDFVCQRLALNNSVQVFARLSEKLYAPQWQKEDLHFMPALTSSTNVLVMMKKKTAFSEALLEELMLTKCVLTLLEGTLTEAKIAETLSGSAAKNLHLVYLASGQQTDDPSGQDYTSLLEDCMALTEIARYLQKAEYESKRLVVLTENAKVITAEDRGLNRSSAALSSLGFLMNNELLGVKVKTIDMPSQASDTILEDCALEVIAQNEDIDIALRESGRYVMHLTPELQLQTDALESLHFDKNATYLIAGGTNGFGLELAKWLAHQGAGHLVLLSRRGLTTEYARHTVAKIRRHGVQVEIKEMDISDERAVLNLVTAINADNTPLKGVFHCAMVLEDALMTTLSEEDYARVMRPKVLGAAYLHQATAHLPLDYFVMTSSIASLAGNIGQANYIAANGFIDGFVHYRRANGLPATTLNIGVLADVGVIARSGELSRYTDLLAITKTPVHLVIKVLEGMLSLNIPTLAIFDFDWLKWEKVDPKSAHSSRFNEIIRLSQQQRAAKGDEDDAHNLLKLLGENEAESVEMLAMLVKNSVAEVLRADPTKIDENANLNQMGIDSLMVSELRNKLISEFDVEMSLVELLKGVSIKDIASLILVRLTQSQN